ITNPSPETDWGFRLFARGNRQMAGKVILKKNRKFSILRNEFEPRDQRPHRFSSLRPSGLVLQAGVKSAEECQHNLLAINVSSASSAFSRAPVRLQSVGQADDLAAIDRRVT
ncbi:MAG: hypothetical protein ABF623_10285, partial [Gluconobacter cerinus]|uniref:hypothetical protein n=1 Tax=Gluconobacter cerinus TaxID=38307 RepID=UPI0039EB15D7